MGKLVGEVDAVCFSFVDKGKLIGGTAAVEAAVVMVTCGAEPVVDDTG